MNHIIDINIYYIAYILFSLLSNLFKQFQILSTLIILNYKTITKGNNQVAQRIPKIRTYV